MSKPKEEEEKTTAKTEEGKSFPSLENQEPQLRPIPKEQLEQTATESKRVETKKIDDEPSSATFVNWVPDEEAPLPSQPQLKPPILTIQPFYMSEKPQSTPVIAPVTSEAEIEKEARDFILQVTNKIPVNQWDDAFHQNKALFTINGIGESGKKVQNKILSYIATNSDMTQKDKYWVLETYLKDLTEAQKESFRILHGEIYYKLNLTNSDDGDDDEEDVPATPPVSMTTVAKASVASEPLKEKEEVTSPPQDKIKELSPSAESLDFFEKHFRLQGAQGLKAAKSSFKEYEAHTKVQNRILEFILLFAKDDQELYAILGEYLSENVLGDKRAADFNEQFKQKVGKPFFADSVKQYEKELLEIFKKGF